MEQVRQLVAELLRNESAFKLDKIIQGMLGDTWLNIACVDRLVELDELQEAIIPYRKLGQERTFSRPAWHQDQDPEALAKFHWIKLYELSDPQNQQWLLEIQNRG